MKNLYYLSSTCFSQVDLGFIHILSRTFDITYGVIIPPKDSNFSEAPLRNFCESNNIKFEPFYLSRRQRDIRIGIELFNILNKINKKDPDIIYTFSFDNPICSLTSLMLNKKKTIIYIHDVEFHSSYSYSLFLRIGRKITTSYFSNFQVFSTNQERIFRKRYPVKRVFTIPLTLSNYGEEDFCKLEMDRDLKKIRFLFFGKILPYKGIELLIKAVNNLSNKYSNFELIIAGRCDDWETIYEPLIQKQHLLTKLIRHIENDEILHLFCSCHYLVLPYTDATQSGPLMIAYNYRLPVIVSDIEAFKEVVKEGITGFFFERELPNGLEFVMESALQRNNTEYKLLLKRYNNYIKKSVSAQSISKKYELMFAEVRSDIKTDHSKKLY